MQRILVLKRGERNASIILNDLHNWEAISRDYDEHKFNWKRDAKDILNKLEDKNSMKIRYKEFVPDQINASMIGYQKKLIDNSDAFVLPQEYREEYYSYG